jgi:hypothetical protein
MEMLIDAAGEMQKPECSTKRGKKIGLCGGRTFFVHSPFIVLHLPSISTICLHFRFVVT